MCRHKEEEEEEEEEEEGRDKMTISVVQSASTLITICVLNI